MKFILCIVSILLMKVSLAQSADEQAVRKILHDQTVNWNAGNLEEFMKGYWKNDSLMFIGKSGVTYGYSNTLENYKRNYGDTVKMGKLSFDLKAVQQISPDAYFVVGKWNLKRTIGDLSGHYTLLFRKINGEWVIVVDHSS
jgi:ketosteroid isomerase-like protein